MTTTEAAQAAALNAWRRLELVEGLLRTKEGTRLASAPKDVRALVAQAFLGKRVTATRTDDRLPSLTGQLIGVPTNFSSRHLTRGLVLSHGQNRTSYVSLQHVNQIIELAS